jgi:hypothetical protein
VTSLDPKGALRAAAWPLAVTAGVLLLLAPGLGPDVTLAWRDSVKEYAPLRPIIAEALHHGRLPLWDPYDGLGLPLLAQYTHGVLHPASLLLALLAPAAHLDVLLVAYVLLAGLGTYAAARALDAPRPAAAAAAIGYAGSGYVLSGLANLPFLAGAATLPWILAAGRLAGLGSRRSATALAAATFSLLVAGDVQAALVGAVLAVALALHAGRWAALPRTAAGLAVGSLLAAVQLLPTRAALALSWRTMGLTPLEREQWALLPWRLPELVAPGWLTGRTGDVGQPVFMALERGTMFPMPFAASVFVGSAVLVAAAATWRVRQARPLLVAAPVLLWLALGHRLGGQQLLHPVPIWGTLRYAEKLVGPLTLVLALLSALGLPRLAVAAPVRRVGALAAAAALLLALLAAPGVDAGALGALLPAEVVATARAQAVEGLAHLTLGLAALAALLALARRRPAAFPPAFAALVLVEALAATPFALYPLPTHGPPLPVTAADAPPPGPRLVTPDRPVFTPGTTDALRQVQASSVALSLPGYNVLARVDNVDAYASLLSERLEWARGMFEPIPTAWRRYGATHVVLPPGQRDGTGMAASVGGQLVREDRHAQVWSVPHREWASFAPSVALVTGLKATVSAILESPAAARGATFLDVAEAPPTSPGRVLSVARGAEAVAVEAVASGPALLVVNDAWWPGWEAELDGAPVDILPADALVRAVRFPQGRHRLVMRYDPPEVRLGLALSAAGLVLLLALAAWEERAGRRGGPAARPPGGRGDAEHRRHPEVGRP